MRSDLFSQRLLNASPEDRRRLITNRPRSVGEKQVNALAERARQEADARPAESLRIAEVACELAEAEGGQRGRALALRARAASLRSAGRWSEALEAFEAGVRAAEAAGDRKLAAQIPIAATETLAQLGRYEEALALAASLEERLLAFGAEEDAAKVLANAGNIHFQREAFSDALRCYERALAFFEAHGQPSHVARLRMNIANVLTQLHRLTDALQMYESARIPLEMAGMDLLVAALDGNVGFLQFSAGLFTEALETYARARQRFEALELTKDVAQCDRESADVYLALNLVPEALETYKRVLPIFAEQRMTEEAARSETGLAAAFAAQELYAESLLALDRAEQAFKGEKNEMGVARVRLQRAELWHRIARQRQEGTSEAEEAPEVRRARDEAIAALLTFRKHKVQMGAIRARLVLAEVSVDLGESPLGPLKQLRNEAAAGALISVLWRIEATFARANLNAGRRRAALSHYRRAVEEVERMRLRLRGDDFRIAFVQDKMRLYEELLALLLERGTRAALIEGFLLAERAKSRALLDMLSRPIEESENAKPERESLFRKLESLRTQLNLEYGLAERLDDSARGLPTPDDVLPERVRRLEKELLQTQRYLQLTGEDSVDTLGSGVVGIREIQSLLGSDEQLVEFFTLRDEVLAFVLDRHRVRTVRGLASRTEVIEQVDRLRFQWSKFAPGDYADRNGADLLVSTQKVLRNLYEMLMEPLADLLTSTRLIVAPYGALHGVPFHALFDGEKYALDRWEFAYTPSGAVWHACRIRGEGKAVKSLLLGVSEPNIAHVRDEVAALGALLPEARVCLDEAAALSAIPADAEFRYIHFATHGVFRKDNPLFSALRLSDGWLIAHDLCRRRLDCSVATLSACRTGLSAVAPGDEVLGLVWGFLHAGARAVLVSLWTADDAATADLMRDFYAGLTHGKGRAQSLRDAQWALRKRYPHPYHWAAFALVGAS